MTRPAIPGLPLAAVVACGMLWGLGQPLGKLAISTGHGHFGLLFWQAALGAAFLGGVLALRRRWPPLTRATLTFSIAVAVLGTIIPGSTFFLSIAHLPSGVMAVNVATVPLIALPIAVALGQDRFAPGRVLGLLMGLAGVLLIAAPEGALPAGVSPLWLVVALAGPLFYAIEGNFVARFGTAGMDALQAFFLASLAAALMLLPVALGSGQFIAPSRPFGVAEWALVASSAVNATAYSAYVWLAATAGAVFAALTSYIVTGAGMVWAMLLLGEQHSGWLWAALVLMLAGVALVQPREERAMGSAA